MGVGSGRDLGNVAVELRGIGKVAGTRELGAAGCTVPTERWRRDVDFEGGRVGIEDWDRNDAGIVGMGFAGREGCPRFAQRIEAWWRRGTISWSKTPIPRQAGFALPQDQGLKETRGVRNWRKRSNVEIFRRRRIPVWRLSAPKEWLRWQVDGGCRPRSWLSAHASLV